MGGIMKRLIFALPFVVLIFAGTAFPQQITLKNNFFTGWKYSFDGSDYHKVGVSGSSLHDAMEGNAPAQEEMLKYKSSKTTATVFAIPGGFLIGWPLGATLAGKEWNDTYTGMIIAGGVMGIVSMVYESWATGHLKKAVSIYNGEEQALGFVISYCPQMNVNEDRLIVGMAFRF
jgi:hypothetical protein